MSADLAVIAARILDKLADVTLGPVLGRVVARATQERVTLHPGQLGTLADGRVIRVRKTTAVGSAPTLVDVRLLSLSPAYPVKANFRPVPLGMDVRWSAPPDRLGVLA